MGAEYAGVQKSTGSFFVIETYRKTGLEQIHREKVVGGLITKHRHYRAAFNCEVSIIHLRGHHIE